MDSEDSKDDSKMTLSLKGRTWRLRRRVPKRYASVESRAHIVKSLHTDSKTVAAQKATALWAQMIEGWEAALRGESASAEIRYQAAREISERRGFRFLSAPQIAELPFDEVLARLEASFDRRGRLTAEGPAILGEVARPGKTMSEALDDYWSISRDKTIHMSADQERIWKTTRKRCFANFIQQIGDLSLHELTGDHMLDFREWLIGRVESGEIVPNTANREIGTISTILRAVNVKKRLGLNLPLGGLMIKDDIKAVRKPFSVEWIKTKLLAPDALAGLNSEARCIVLGMVNTGYRPSEGAALTPARIRLDATIPHISIEPEGRVLKTSASQREIPLVGVSLEAFKAFNGGFPRYADKATSLSALVNKYLARHGLKETPEHTLYGLRHSFEDRMLAAGIDERIRRDLFGHALNRERYGNGASLEHKARLLKGIAL